MAKQLMIKADIALVSTQPEMWWLLGHISMTVTEPIADMLEYILGMVLAGFNVELI